eukprot:CAMPEP_0117522144 /NCGR_PEP_ID=MMETSP0784-20121206/34055_1 /TAXON_ID=39447 /ORGANISM="" /LENGTH=78 /DNA_ID=CAMNT_0005318205 /DNA_START=963 /DNA_END=1196 /DNA_ORIENTATION=+
MGETDGVPPRRLNLDECNCTNREQEGRGDDVALGVPIGFLLTTSSASPWKFPDFCFGVLLRITSACSKFAMATEFRRM